jgi:hypothetical protein
VKGLYLVRLLDNEGDDQYLCMVYAESFEDFYWQVDEQGFDPYNIQIKKVKMGAVTLKYEDVCIRVLNTGIPKVDRLRQVNNGDNYDYKEFKFQYDGLSESLISEIENPKEWKSMKQNDIKNKTLENEQ